MPLLPYDTLLVESPLPPEDALARLRGATGPRKWFHMARVDHEWHGDVEENRVRIQRVIYHRNSFMPWIRAVVEPAPGGGSRLRGTMAMHPVLSVFTVIWFGAIVCFVGAVAWMGVRDGLNDPLMLAVPAGMLVFAWAMIAGAFTYEARRARTMLTELLAARPGSPFFATGETPRR